MFTPGAPGLKKSRLEMQMFSKFTIAVAAATIVLSPVSFADVTEAAPDGFVIQLERSSDLTVSEVQMKARDIGHWWSSGHSYSGDAANMSLEPACGSFFWIERWDAGFVEHGRVLVDMESEVAATLRFQAALGPLQEMGVNGVLSIVTEAETHDETPEESVIRFQYVITGASFSGLDGIAEAVNMVLTEQIESLVASPEAL